MKRVSRALMLFFLLLTGVSITYSQNSSAPATSTETTVAAVPASPQPKAIVITSDLGIQIPSDQPMIYEYRLDTKNLHFTTPADQQKYFEALNDAVVTYRIDPADNTVFIVLNKDYIDRNKWQTSDINKYLKARSSYMKQQYTSYEHPKEGK